jgi:hypothetical protein
MARRRAVAHSIWLQVTINGMQPSGALATGNGIPTLLGYPGPGPGCQAVARARAGVADLAHRVHAAHHSSPLNCAGHARLQGHRCELDARRGAWRRVPAATRGARSTATATPASPPAAALPPSSAGPNHLALAAARARRGCAPGAVGGQAAAGAQAPAAPRAGTTATPATPTAAGSRSGAIAAARARCATAELPPQCAPLAAARARGVTEAVTVTEAVKSA